MKSKKNIPQKTGGFCIWLTGLPCSGKTTLARMLERILKADGLPVLVLDGDELRRSVSRDLGFSRKDRDAHILRVARLAVRLVEQGIIVICALVSPYEKSRRSAAGIIGPARFFEIFVDTPLAVCQARDVKGLYERARKGEIANFTGVTDPYEPPKRPALRFSTEPNRPAAKARRVINFLLKNKILKI